MSNDLILLVTSETDVRARLGPALNEAGFRVLTAPNDAAALASLDDMRLLLPDLVALSLPEGDSLLLSRLRANPVSIDVPVVLLAKDSEQRRRGLRLGLTEVVEAPYEAEEMVLICRLALDRAGARRRSEREMTGSLQMLAAPDLLQTLEAGRRSAVIVLRSSGREATLWMREGQLVDARLGDGRAGQGALFEALSFADGSFSVSYGPVSTPDRLGSSTTGLLLEWSRQQDEANALPDSPFASIPDTPPLPPRETMIAHRALTLLNVASAYAANYFEPALLSARLQRAREDTLPEHSVLACFQVSDLGQVSMAGPPTGRPENLVAAASAWALNFFKRLERAMPGHFEPARLRALTEAVREDMTALGFDQGLGLVVKETR